MAPTMPQPAPPARPAAPAPVAAPAPAPAVSGFGGGFGELDLPAIPQAQPKPAAMGFAPAPPAAAAPAAPMGGGFGGGFGELDLPALPTNNNPRPGFGGGGGAGGGGGFGGGGFGGADLPSLSGGNVGLPMSPGGNNGLDLPMAHGGGAGLPMPAGGGIGLPMPHGGGAGLPMALGGFGDFDLPALGGDLPSAQNNLPSAPGDLPQMAGGLPMAAGSLPMAQNSLPMSGGSLPMAQNSLPMAQNSLPMAQNELPGIAGLFDNNLPTAAGGGNLVSFGDFEPGEASLATSAPNQGGAGGMSFGEVDLGGDNGPGVVVAPPAAISGARMDDALQVDPKPKPERYRPLSEGRPRRMWPKIVGGIVAVGILGGVALSVTSAGPFGFYFFQDKIYSGKYLSTAAEAAAAARKKLAADGYQTSQAAANDVAVAHAALPRSRPLTAYAAFVEFSVQARFGSDASRAGRAKTFLTDIPPGTDVPYLFAAQGAQELVAGELPKARAHLDQAAQHDSQDPISQEIAQVQGELELQANDGKTALAAFQRAHAKGAAPRSFYGIARAHFLLGNLDDSKKATDQTLAQAPTHAGALTLRGWLSWKRDHAADDALKDLALVIDGAAKVNASPKERSQALAERGWVMIAKDHAGEARAAFEEALKIDQRNVLALMGQGELLFADGRNTEAATRFDEAFVKDPSNNDALIGSARTKIALERYADAKAQLTAGLKTFPKDMRVPLWLAFAEEKSGNRGAAEKLYKQAITLADPKHPDAILAYGKLSQMLAAQGRVQEAQQQLDQAKEKLPDSPALQRALAEVAEAQGKYDEAVSHYEKALEKDPQDLGAHFKLGVTYRKMRKLDLATKEFDLVAAQDKDYPSLTTERGQLFEDSGEADKALAQFKAAFDKDPKDVDLKLRLGAAYVALGDLDNAQKFLKEVLEVRPNSAEAKHYYGRIFLKRGGKEVETALTYFNQAVAADSNKPIYHMYVAWAANSTNPVQTPLAQAAVEKALALDQNYADAYWQRGIIEYNLNALKDAQKDLKRALELNPTRLEAHATLAQVHERMNDDGAALAEWSKAYAANKDQFDWDYEYGILLLDKNQVGQAATVLSDAVRVGEAAVTKPGRLYLAHFRLAQAQKKLGKKTEAVTHYKAYLDAAPPTDPDRNEAKAELNALGGGR
jgi:tetratricopeptide (TPR) repeat protein